MTVVDVARVHFGMFSTRVFNEPAKREGDDDALARIADGMDFQGLFGRFVPLGGSAKLEC